MSVSPGLADLSRLYQTEFVRSARAVGVLWAVCTLCFAVIQVVILVQPSWVGTTASGPPLPSGTMGLFEVCLESDWPVPDCRGGLSSLSPLPSFQSVAVLVGVSLWAVWTSVLCLCLFRFCSAATVYKICAWLQLTAGFCLALACLLFPDSWESPEMRVLCGDSDPGLGSAPFPRWAASLQVTALSTGPTSWRCWASWTTPSWPRWPSSWPTGRTPCCHPTPRM
ncbi:lipoma HMGIC fusion partner-like 3 protein isoform X1 [Poecilia latipinna]|uniref:lipoma HMGIC fusion partner-like 3 protein isoform X1 n=1 Tax=Poecilia latipinna TaxID=48699 RepID=UPI00072E3DB0|nr:PREDICTED: lipoma HMGIC fusion partner-like 3 protein isoform X1 [Poecilia latipinna]